MSTLAIDKVVCDITNHIVARKNFEKLFSTYIRKHYISFVKNIDPNNALKCILQIMISITDSQVLISAPGSTQPHEIPHTLDRESLVNILNCSCKKFVSEDNTCVTYPLSLEHLEYDALYFSLSEDEIESPSTIENMLIAVAKDYKAEIEEFFIAEFASFLSKNWKNCLDKKNGEYHVKLYVRHPHKTLIESQMRNSNAPHLISALPTDAVLKVLEKTHNVHTKLQVAYDGNYYEVTYSI